MKCKPVAKIDSLTYPYGQAQRHEGIQKMCTECRLIGYQNPVRTSQETHYVSGTDPSLLMLCTI
jgi:hypothetical protein